MTENVCLRYDMHSMVNMTKIEALHFIGDVFKEFCMIYEKMTGVQHTELKRLFAEVVPRLISVLILAEYVRSRNCHQEQSSYISLGE